MHSNRNNGYSSKERNRSQCHNYKIHTEYIECAADTNNEFSLADGIGAAKGVGSFYVASATTSTVCVVMVEG